MHSSCLYTDKKKKREVAFDVIFIYDRGLDLDVSLFILFMTFTGEDLKI